MADEDVEDWVKGLDSITESMRDVSRLQTGIIKGFTEITSTSKATGQAWISVARFFSGTGFWKVQNKIKSVANLLKAAQLIEEKRLKQEQEMLEEVVKREDALKNIKRVKIALENLNNNEAAHEEFKLIYSSKYFKMLQMTLGTTTALMVMRTKMEKAEKKANESKADHNKLLIKQQYRLIKQGEENRIGKKDFNNLTKQEKADLSALFSLQKQREDAFQVYRKSSGDERKAAKEFLDETKKEMMDLADGFSDDIKFTTTRDIKGASLSEKIESGAKIKTAGLTEDATKERGKNVFSKQFDKLKGEASEFKIDMDPSSKPRKIDDIILKWIARKEKFDKFKDKLSKIEWKNMDTYKDAANASWSFISKKGKMIGNFLSKGLLLFAQAMMFITLAVMGFFLLKKLGVFRWLQDTFAALMEWFTGIFEWVSLVWEYASAFIDSISILFEDFSIDNLVTAFVALVDLIGVVIVGFWTKVVWPLVKDVLWMPIWNWLNEFLNLDWKEKFWSSAFKLIGTIIVIIIVIKLVLIALPVLIAALPFIFAGIIIFAIGKAIRDALPFADGGIVSNNGLQIVGEKGPELVNLPNGTRVHSNKDSRKMMGGGTTNITVNVQGRIGASDAEVRDMATKVSKIISREINRSTSTGTRG